jgi:5-methylcytosine-specific restriction endonuclease McrA
VLAEIERIRSGIEATYHRRVLAAWKRAGVAAGPLERIEVTSFMISMARERVAAGLDERDNVVTRRAAREAAAPGSHTAGQKQGRWDYYQGRCWMCGEAAHHMDHVKPLARGGSQWPANLRPACWPCNKRKAARWPWGPAQYGAGLAVMRLRESAARGTVRS